MSIRALAWAFDQTTGSPISKLVLIKLADNANEQTGLCIPSIPTISQQTELSPRAIQLHIKKLEDLKLVRIERRMVGDVHVSNRYYLAFGGGASHAGVVHDMHQGGAPRSPGVVHDMRPNQKIEPELNLKNSTPIPRNLDNPEFIEAFEEFKKHRKKIKKPLTDYGAKLLLSKLAREPNRATAALNLSIENGWQGVEIEWLDRRNGQNKPKRPVENAI